MSFFKEFYFKLYVLKRLIKKEIFSNVKLPLKIKFKMWVNGFFSSSYIRYNLNEKTLRDFLSDYQENVKAVRINKENAHLLDDKLKFNELIKPFLTVVKDYGVIKNGKIQLNHSHSFSDLLSLKKKLIIKPIDSSSGSGVIKLEQNESGNFVNDVKITAESFDKIISTQKNSIITDFIKPADYLTGIYGKALSTIRILTMISPSTKKAFVAAAAHRFVTDKSFPVDNCNAGGLTANIDLQTGRLGMATAPYFKGNSLQWFENHPDTEGKIKGVIIPFWDEIKTKILSVAEKLSYIKYIGWDIAVTDDGFIVIEGNDGPDIKLHQVHQPLLTNNLTKEFYSYYNVI
jgi:hypothetical protein